MSNFTHDQDDNPFASPSPPTRGYYDGGGYNNNNNNHIYHITRRNTTPSSAMIDDDDQYNAGLANDADSPYPFIVRQQQSNHQSNHQYVNHREHREHHQHPRMNSYSYQADHPSRNGGIGNTPISLSNHQHYATSTTTTTTNAAHWSPHPLSKTPSSLSSSSSSSSLLTPPLFGRKPTPRSVKDKDTSNHNNHKHTTSTSSNVDVIKSARKLWQQHGVGITQHVEEIRRKDECRPGTLTVRLIGSDRRRDMANKTYIAYILQVKLPTSTVQIEHRYSDFAKLYEQFVQYGYNSKLDPVAPFPPKNLAGRMGNWTPSLLWAPTKHEELIQYRTIQLDIWLTYVCEMYNIGDVPYALSQSIYTFLTVYNRPPCELDNTTTTTLNFSSYDTANNSDNVNSNNTVTATSTSSISLVRWNNPISFTLGSSIRQACKSVEQMCLPPTRRKQRSITQPSTSSSTMSDQSIPLDLLHCAKGLIFLTVFKAGLVVSGRVGTGLLIARLDNENNNNTNDNHNNNNNDDNNNNTYDENNPVQEYNARWSAPVALGTVGMGWGMLAGADVTHYLVVLTTESAVDAMVRGGNVQLGTEVGIAAGPIGRSTQVCGAVSTTTTTTTTTSSSSSPKHGWNQPWAHPAYSYAHSQGLFVGMSLEGSILSTRHDVNAKFYGQTGLTPGHILWDVPPPRAAQPLYHIIDHALAQTISSDTFRPLSQWMAYGNNSSGSSDDPHHHPHRQHHGNNRDYNDRNYYNNDTNNHHRNNDIRDNSHHSFMDPSIST
jgi:lipid-binding SYLF domain-containing protein